MLILLQRVGLVLVGVSWALVLVLLFVPGASHWGVWWPYGAAIGMIFGFLLMFPARFRRRPVESGYVRVPPSRATSAWIIGICAVLIIVSAAVLIGLASDPFLTSATTVLVIVSALGLIGGVAGLVQYLLRLRRDRADLARQQ